MTQISRREFLQFIGGGSAVAVAATMLPFDMAQAALPPLNFTPVRLPHPLEIYTTHPSFLPTGLNGAGSVLAASVNGELSSYSVIDDVCVPPEFERYQIVAWGDRVFPNGADYVGYNHDYTAYTPLVGINDGLLWINHEYTSYPFSVFSPATNPGFATASESFPAVIGFPLPGPANSVLYLGESLYNVGGSIVRIRRVSRGGRFAPVVADPLNRRIHGLSGLALNAGPRTGTFPSAWGTFGHQAGDGNYLVGTGPAASEVFAGVNADGLGNRIIGTIANCSGGHTPWGTILSAEENFQGSALFFVGVQEICGANGTQFGYLANTAGNAFGMIGEKYGYMVEVDPRTTYVPGQEAHPMYRARKHSLLGRFRHENVALRVETGKPLVAYLGDDRRGGHTWKYVSSAVVTNVTDPANSALFENGTLYVAKFNADGPTDPNGTAISGSGEWIPIALSTPVNPNDPLVLRSVHLAGVTAGLAALPAATATAVQAAVLAEANGRVNLPQRVGIAGVAALSGSFFNLNSANRNTTPAGGRSFYDQYKFNADPANPAANGTQKTLADYYSTLGAALVDAYAAANLVGGTPCGRPEDIEVHPQTKEVFIAMTDNRPGGDGYPDSRVFQVAKYFPAVDATQQSGGLYKIVETGGEPGATTFAWSRFVQGGEDGTVQGGGFANADNLIFDSKMNLWGVTDMTTSLHNAVDAGPTPVALPVSHGSVGGGVNNLTVNHPTNENLVGTYGNNWLFYIPTTGVAAGQVVPFAAGPVRCEMTGPTFVGETLIISVQHPGEDSPTGAAVTLFPRNGLELLKLDGSGVFFQNRLVPSGSNWPENSNLARAATPAGSAFPALAPNPTAFPRPCTIGIRRKNGAPLV